MAYEPFPIADFQTGIFTAKEAWISPENAFRKLVNITLTRGKLEKRTGFDVVGLFPELIGTIGTISLGGSEVSIQFTSHGLVTGDYILIQNETGTTELNNKHWHVTRTDDDNFTLTNTDVSNFSAANSDGNFSQIKSHANGVAISSIAISGTDGRPIITTSSNHGYSTGDRVHVVDDNAASNVIAGMTEIADTITDIEKLTDTTFALNDVDGSDFQAHTSGGLVFQIQTNQNQAIIGVGEFEQDEATNEIIVCSQRKVGKWNASGKLIEPIDSSTSEKFTASATEYIQYTNWKNKLYMVTRSPQDSSKDGIWTWDGSNLTQFTNGSSPTISGSTNLDGAKFLFAYNGRLVALFTNENGTKFPQRARWTQRNQPEKWDETNPNEGGSLDAATEQEIVSATILKNTLIVIFENSIWALQKTGSSDIPFKWEEIISSVAFFKGDFTSANGDQIVLALGRGGIFATDGVQALPFDEQIPGFHEIIRDDALEFCFLFKDADQKQIWFLFPNSEDTSSIFNNEVRIYDYESEVWYDYTIEMNVLGSVESIISGSTWNDVIDRGNKYWTDLTETVWKELINFIAAPDLMGGDRFGMVYLMNSGGSDAGKKITCTLESQRLSPLKAQGRASSFGYMDVLFDKNDDGIFTFNFNADWISGAIVSQDINPSYSSTDAVTKVWERIFNGTIGNIHSFDMTHSEQSGKFSIHAFVPYFRDSGRINF